MNILSNLKISTKIVALLLMLGAITVFIAWKGSSQSRAASDAYSDLIRTTMPNATKLSRINRSATSMAYSSYRVMSYDGGSKQARDAANEEVESYGKAKTRLTEIVAAEPSLRDEMAVLGTRIDKLHEITSRAIALGLANRNDEARQLLAEADVQVASFVKDNLALTEERVAFGDKEAAALATQSASTSTMLIVMSVIGVIGGVCLAVFVARLGITGPLKRLQDQMGDIAAGDYRKDVEGGERGDELGAMAKAVRVFRENGIAKDASDAAKARGDAEQKMVVDTVSTHLSELSSGDLTATITEDFPPEYGALKSNYNEALNKLRDLIGSVSESATTIQTGSVEIAQASEDLARRTESNAASLEETAASVTQMDGRLRASATAASRTVERADQAIATVGGGRAVADQAVQAMGRVSESAKGIDSVIEGLDKIAFQTRVLAMNAAVEAGRAGDAGRGFAVVADLVSALAMRAEEEAKRARDQLTVTQTDIVTAVDAVTKVDGALANISGDVSRVHELLATMAADNQAQSAAITQISAAIGTMDQSTQQNAAMVEETSAAARNLASEVGNLADQAGRFKVAEGGTRRPASVAAKPDYSRPSSYTSPIKPLPVAAISALVRAEDDDWKSF